MMKSSSLVMDEIEAVISRIRHVDDRYVVNNNALAMIVSESLGIAFGLAIHQEPRSDSS